MFSNYNSCYFFFFFNDTATTEIYTLSLHDALPISAAVVSVTGVARPEPDPAAHQCWACRATGMSRHPAVRATQARLWSRPAPAPLSPWSCRAACCRSFSPVDIGMEQLPCLACPYTRRCIESMSMNASWPAPGSSGARPASPASSSRCTFSSWRTFPQVNDRRNDPSADGRQPIFVAAFTPHRSAIRTCPRARAARRRFSSSAAAVTMPAMRRPCAGPALVDQGLGAVGEHLGDERWRTGDPDPLDEVVLSDIAARGALRADGHRTGLEHRLEQVSQGGCVGQPEVVGLAGQGQQGRIASQPERDRDTAGGRRGRDGKGLIAPFRIVLACRCLHYQ